MALPAGEQVLRFAFDAGVGGYAAALEIRQLVDALLDEPGGDGPQAA